MQSLGFDEHFSPGRPASDNFQTTERVMGQHAHSRGTVKCCLINPNKLAAAFRHFAVRIDEQRSSTPFSTASMRARMLINLFAVLNETAIAAGMHRTT